jgi:prepilin-type N-terminal cleavage/methylation domain-containing protein
MKNKGFSLVELLVTMAIISIMFAVIVPKLEEFRNENISNKTRVEDLRISND